MQAPARGLFLRFRYAAPRRLGYPSSRMAVRGNHPPDFCYVSNRNMLKIVIDFIVLRRCRKALAGDPSELYKLRRVCRYFWKHRKIEEVMWKLRYFHLHGQMSPVIVTFPETVRYVLSRFRAGETLKFKVGIPHPKVNGVVFVTLILEDPDAILFALQELLCDFVNNECDHGDFDRVDPRFRTQLSTWTQAIKRFSQDGWRACCYGFLELYFRYPTNENIWCAEGCVHWLFNRKNQLYLPSCFTSRAITGKLREISVATSLPHLARTNLGSSTECASSSDDDVVSI